MKPRKLEGTNRTVFYVDYTTIVRRLNDVCPSGWSFEINDQREFPFGATKAGNQRMLLRTTGTLTIPELGSRSHTGVQVVNATGGGEDLWKGSASDCFKKCASMFGVGLELVGPDYEADDATTNAWMQEDDHRPAKEIIASIDAMPQPTYGTVAGSMHEQEGILVPPEQFAQQHPASPVIPEDAFRPISEVDPRFIPERGTEEPRVQMTPDQLQAEAKRLDARPEPAPRTLIPYVTASQPDTGELDSTDQERLAIKQYITDRYHSEMGTMITNPQEALAGLKDMMDADLGLDQHLWAHLMSIAHSGTMLRTFWKSAENRKMDTPPVQLAYNNRAEFLNEHGEQAPF